LRSDAVRPVEQAPSENRSLRVSRGEGFYVNQNMCKIYLQEQPHWKAKNNGS